MSEKIVFIAATRSPIGSIGGALSSVLAQPLATTVIKNLLEQAGVDPKLVDYTALGWVMQDPRSPNIAKTAAELAGVPSTSPGTTLHENCNSGGAAIHTIARRLLLGEIKMGIAGGVESMSNVARYLYPGRLKGQLYGNMQLEDGLFGALTDTYVNDGELMGLLTERLVERYNLNREEQDEIAYRSHHNALAAWKDGSFADYVVPVEVKSRRKTITVEQDEGPREITKEELKKARPYFKKGGKKDGGTITTLNASSMNDAAAMLLMTTESHAKELGLKPLAELRAYSNIGVAR
ncbi:thiolase family protein, partial [Myxococcota bacterium]|nr:thiolase family protein [Myxococcota bacterium]